MCAQSCGGDLYDRKNYFECGEGGYKLIQSDDLNNRRNYAVFPHDLLPSIPVKLSYSVPSTAYTTQDFDTTVKLCYNLGKELFVYEIIHHSHATRPEHMNILDHRLYKITHPTYHDFNTPSSSSSSAAVVAIESPTDNASNSTQASCTHSSFESSSSSSIPLRLLVGFTRGQILLIDLVNKEQNKLLNEEQLIDQTRVTCLKWVPSMNNRQNHFLVSHASGYMYLYNEHLPSGGSPPGYQLFKTGHGFCVHTCKTKSTRNPLYRWQFGVDVASSQSLANGFMDSGGANSSNSFDNRSLLSSAASRSSASADSSLLAALQASVNAPTLIHQFAFSPCAQYLAVVTQDGYLRIFDYHKMELTGKMRSYFGGLLCVSWSPEGTLVAVGGQDDLVTIWSVADNCVVCRCQGHRSWVSAVAFDPILCPKSPILNGNDAPTPAPTNITTTFTADASPLLDGGQSSTSAAPPPRPSSTHLGRSYRLGSVGHDTQFCLWDVTEDEIRQGVRFAMQLEQMDNENGADLLLSGATPTTSSSTTTNGQHHSAESVGLSDQHQSQSNNGSTSKRAFGTHKLFRLSSSGIGTLSSNSSLSQSTPTSATLSRVMDKLSSHSTHPMRLTHNSSSATSGKSHHSGGAAGLSSKDAESRLLGTKTCPRLEDVPILAPIVCRRVSQDRLTDLLFRDDVIVMVSQCGTVYSWARPTPPTHNTKCSRVTTFHHCSGSGGQSCPNGCCASSSTECASMTLCEPMPLSSHCVNTTVTVANVQRGGLSSRGLE